MVNQEKTISFNSFFIIEFIQQVLEKARLKFDENAIHVFENLAESLKATEDPILVLEKLARYQETNDLSIFLFDMLDRVEKIPPHKTIENLDGLSDDFINLYTLMVEDQEVMAALDMIMDEIKPLKPKVAEEKAEHAEALSFEEFYQKEVEGQIAAAFAEDESKEFHSFLEIIRSKYSKEQTYATPFTGLVAQIEKVFRPNDDAISTENLINRIEQNVQALAQKCREFKEEQPEQFKRIVEDGELPLAPVTAKEKSETTIDDLLKEYFRSEVEDHIDLIKTILNTKFSRRSLSSLIKNFKSLKEVSMIHGYSGVESLCEQIMRILRKHENEVNAFTPAFREALTEILTTLHSLEKIDFSLPNSNVVDEINRLIGQLKKAFTVEEKIEEPEVPIAKKAKEPAVGKAVLEEIPQLQEQEEPLINFEDRPKIFQIFREMLEKLTLDLAPFKPTGDYARFVNALLAVTESANWLSSNIDKQFFTPFIQTYQRIFASEEINKSKALSALAQGWQIFLDELHPETALKNVQTFWQSFNLDDFVAKRLLTESDNEVIQAFADAMHSAWQKVQPKLGKALSAGDEKALARLAKFLGLLQTNLALLKLNSYVLLPEFFNNEFIERGKRIARADLINEIEQTMDLFFERLRAKGKEGVVNDLVDVLREILGEELLKSEATEDEIDFIKDSEVHVDNALKLLQGLREDPQNRELCNTIAGEVHAIYSAAQFMNYNRVADAAIIIEETAEMFSAPDVPLPAGLADYLESALKAVKELIVKPQLRVTEPFEALQNILDQLVLEQPLSGESKPQGMSEEEPITVEEKPLFSGKIAEDEELSEIFKEDAKTLLATLIRTNKSLLRNPVDEQNIIEFDQAVHTLKNAAKMTGLDDLGLILSRFEEISEQCKENPSLSTKKFQQKIESFLQEFDPILLKGKPDAKELDAALTQLDEIAASMSAAQKDEEERAERLRNLFVEEARELIEKINHNLIELEKVPESSTVLAELLRYLHTLKGGALMANYTKIGGLAHKLEDYFQLYRDQNAENKLELLPTAFTIIDLISEMVRSVEQGKPEIVSRFTARLADIDNKLFYLKDFEIPKELQQPEKKPQEGIEEPLAVPQADNTIKIKSSYLDHLVNLATEMVVNRTELTSYFETLKKLVTDLDNRKKDMRHFTHQLEDFIEESTFGESKNLPPAIEQDYEILSKFTENLKNISSDITRDSGSINKLMRTLEKNVSQLSVLSKSLHGDLLKARMRPIRLLFERFERPVRDLARKQRKQIELLIEDNRAELDRAMVDALYEPLLHIIRNAVDHGIEKPAQRKKLGKEAKGKIILRARQEKSQVVIDIIDDGQGIDFDKIRKKIVNLKLANAKDVKKISESRLLEHIFKPEFSTSEKTTTVSGRGIGLDIVVSEIQKLKGIVRVKTTKNLGTVFSIRVPLTLIVSQAMLIKFHNQTVAIPLLAVMESIQISEEDILLDDQRAYVQVRGKLLPYVDIDEILRIPGEEQPKAQKSTALVLHDSGVSIVLGIEEISGRQDIVIKSLGSLLQNVDLISGGTILTNGEVGLILDYASLIHKVETKFFAGLRERQLIRKIISYQKESRASEIEGFIDQGEIAAKLIHDREPVILVVDDAVSVREFISSFLERNGFKTLKASDGKEALTLVKKNAIDMLITDLEMPKMHGFDLIEKIRKMAPYKTLPIIILTAQAGKSFQSKGAEVGANAFISKPFKEGDLLRMINAFIKVE